MKGMDGVWRNGRGRVQEEGEGKCGGEKEGGEKGCDGNWVGKGKE